MQYSLLFAKKNDFFFFFFFFFLMKPIALLLFIMGLLRPLIHSPNDTFWQFESYFMKLSCAVLGTLFLMFVSVFVIS